MGKSSVRILKKAQANLGDNISKRTVTINEDKLNIFMSILSSSSELKRGYFYIKDKIPSFIKDLSEEIKLLYGLKDEANGFGVYIYPPDKSTGEKNYELPSPSMSIVSRVIMTFGGSENFTLKISQKGATAEEDIFLQRNGSFNINMGLLNSIDVQFNTSNTFKVKAFSRGGRPETKNKNSSRRTILIMDFDVNYNILASTMGDQVSKLMSGDNIKNDLKDASKIIQENEEMDFFMKEVDMTEVNMKEEMILDEDDEGLVIVNS